MLVFMFFLYVIFFIQHCVKSVRIRSYSGPHFPTLGLYTERHGISLRTQSKWGKMRTRIIPNMDTFHAVQDAAEYRTNTVCLFIFAFPTSSLREKCPNTIQSFFWSVFSYIRTEYGDLRSKSPYSIWMQENTDKKNSVFGHFSRSTSLKKWIAENIQNKADSQFWYK